MATFAVKDRSQWTLSGAVVLPKVCWIVFLFGAVLVDWWQSTTTTYTARNSREITVL